MDIDEESYVSRENIFHDGTDFFSHHLLLALVYFKYELVMDLQKHTGSMRAFLQEIGHLYHSKLDNVCSGSLNRHIDRLALCCSTDHLVTVPYTGNMTPPPVERLHIPVLLRSIEYGLIIGTDSWIHRIESVDIFRRFRGRRVDDLREAESGNAVYNSEINRFRDPAKLGSNDCLLSEKKTCSACMDILSSRKSIHERPVSRKTRKDT